MSYLTYVTIPIISAFIGWITNYIAVKMIFRPLKPIRFLGITLWGLIPKRRADLARKIGETIENELISHDDLHAIIGAPDFREEIVSAIMVIVDRLISNKFGSNMIVAMLLNGDIGQQLRESLKQELREQLPEFIESMFEKMEQRLDFKEIVRKKIEQFELLKLEQLIYKIASQELRAIEILGGVLGFVIGIVQVLLILVQK